MGATTPKVTLMNKEQLKQFPPEVVMGEFGSASYASESSPEKITKGCLEAHHMSVTRPVNFIFHVEGVSRAFSHQLVRLKTGADYNQRSQRYVNESGFDYVIPPSILKNSQALKEFEHTMAMLQDSYATLAQLGIPAEDARFILPNACETVVNYFRSFEALQHELGKRLCSRAQWEYREVAQQELKEVLEVSPFFEPYLKPQCELLGYCPEAKCCGKALPKKTALELLRSAQLAKNVGFTY